MFLCHSVSTTSSVDDHRPALIFTLLNVVAVAQTWAISIGLTDYVLPNAGISRFAPEIAHVADVAFPVFTKYLGHKHWSFR